MIRIKKELLIFTVLFLIASFVVHLSQWLSMPLVHLSALSSHSMPYHPVLYVFIIYILVLVLRGVFALLKKIFRK